MSLGGLPDDASAAASKTPGRTLRRGPKWRLRNSVAAVFDSRLTGERRAQDPSQPALRRQVVLVLKKTAYDRERAVGRMRGSWNIPVLGLMSSRCRSARECRTSSSLRA
jgi:hypothetical protein